ncbi:MAG: sensor domain-containing diguanylate cyclase [Hydrogenovibrio sp.]|uniref:sensor domain-containing diguanylate cyclase n=1 Tax=Hydrogenovibrio sp. TaxID=2065821 RepID=UPI00286FC810|nr:sensor domain-containing diguanylate cyclase [Hydrogenovibrio sp.]MDR9499071.1 sensor domain-containing diguanylate cyclase [Hydrogenovibrio sp.]
MPLNKQLRSLPKDTMFKIIEAQSEITKTGLDLGTVMSIITDKAQDLTRASGAVIELAEDDEMVYRAASGKLEPYLGLRLNAEGSLSGMCVKQGEVLSSDDCFHDERVDRQACKKIGIQSMVVIPLNHHSETIGVLKVASDQPAFFNRKDITALTLISDIVASMIFNAIRFSNDELVQRATRDELTQLSNRAHFYDLLRQHLHQADRRQQKLGVIMLDMNRLKPLNDDFGHLAGDAGIKEVAERLKASVRKPDTVARLGGDEFAIILPETRNSDQLRTIANVIDANMHKPFKFDDHAHTLSVSWGFAIYPDDGDTIKTLIETADKAMYRQKTQRSETR